jgi:hypothetical protein
VVLAAAALGGILAVVYPNVIFGGASLVYSDNHNPLDDPFVPRADGPGLLSVEEWRGRNLRTSTNFMDVGGTVWQWEPAGEFLRKGFWRGEFPLWDPYVGAGAPAMANPTGAFFFPPYVAAVLLGNTSLLKNAYFLSLLLAAGFFTFLFLRRHGLSWVASLFGGAAFMLGGSLNQNVGSLMGQTLACLPIVLFATRLFLDRPTWRRAGALALVYAAVSLSSFPPLLLLTFGFAAFYAAGMIAFGRDSGHVPRSRALLRFAIASSLALGLVAFFYVPFLVLVRSTTYLEPVYKRAGTLALPFTSLWQLFSPVLLGATTTGGVLADSPVPELFWVRMPYLGWVALLSVLLAGARTGEQKRLLGLSLATAVLVALKMTGVEPVQSLGRLPGLNRIHFAIYGGGLLHFTLAIIGSLGVETVAAGRRLGARTFAVAVFGLWVLHSFWRIAAEKGVFAHHKVSDWLLSWRFSAALLAATVLVLVLAASNRRWRLAPEKYALALLSLLVAEGVMNDAYPRQRRVDVWRNPLPYARRIMAKASPGRVFSALAFRGNAGSAFEVPSVESYLMFNSARFLALFNRYAVRRPAYFIADSDVLPPEGILDRAAVDMVAVWRGFPQFHRQVIARGYREVFRDGLVLVYRRRTQPPYYFTSEYRLADGAAAKELVGSLPPGRELVLESAPSLAPAPNQASDPPVGAKECRRNSCTLVVDAPRPGFLYWSATFFPGWTARVNGRPASIRVANFAFRAVEVPAGPVEVRFSYWPEGLSAGLALSGLSAAALTVLVVRGGSPGARS